MKTYSQKYYENNREKLLEYQRNRRKKVIDSRGYIRKVCEDPKMKESYKKRNATRYNKNKTTGRYKEIISRQNEWIKKQYEMCAKLGET